MGGPASIPWAPRLSFREQTLRLQAVDPFFVSLVWDTGVGVTVVDEDIELGNELRVQGDRGRARGGVVKARLARLASVSQRWRSQDLRRLTVLCHSARTSARKSQTVLAVEESNKSSGGPSSEHPAFGRVLSCQKLPKAEAEAEAETETEPS